MEWCTADNGTGRRQGEGNENDPGGKRSGYKEHESGRHEKKTYSDFKNQVLTLSSPFGKAKSAMQLSVIDQENDIKKIAQWSELSPSSPYFFRRYKETNSTMESPSDSNVDSCDDSHA